jgi:hypothetical protein
MNRSKLIQGVFDIDGNLLAPLHAYGRPQIVSIETVCRGLQTSEKGPRTLADNEVHLHHARCRNSPFEKRRYAELVDEASLAEGVKTDQGNSQ